MIEQYVINEIKELKAENSKLKQVINMKNSKPIQWVDEEPVFIELLSEEVVIRKLEENSIDIIKIEEEMSSNEISDLIKKYKLYKEKSNKNNVFYGVVKFNEKYYMLEKYYGGYKLDEEVYINLDKAIYHELSDELYDIALRYKRKIESEKENKENE